MKKKLIVLTLILILAISVTGCQSPKDKVDEAINPSEQNIEKNQQEDSNESDDVKAAAKKENISVKELNSMLDELAEMGAEKYSITKAEYIQQIENNGNTVLSEWQVAADQMGLSIKELYQHEKNSGNNMTDEQKEMMANMGNAVKMAEDELSDMPEPGTSDVENMLGIYGNDSGEVRIVTGDFEEDFYYKADNIIEEPIDEYSIGVEYDTNENLETISQYYISLLENTEGYMLLAPKGAPITMIQGKYNEIDVYVEIDGEDGSVHVSNYLDLTSKQ